MKCSILLTEIQFFLTRYCHQERRLSRLTILSYRDTLKLFLNYIHHEKKKTYRNIEISDFNYELVSDFLNYLEKKRNVSVSTRNQRLCAINSFLKYVLFKHPDYADTISRALAVPQKKKNKIPRTFLEPEEVELLLKSVEQKKWTGKRDRLLIDLCIRTGVRVSEVVGLQCENVVLGKSPFISVMGKGRKERSIPIDRSLEKNLSNWIRENKMDAQSYIFPSVRGEKMSTDAVQYLLRKYIAIARKSSPALVKKKVTPHTLRHTTAMTLLNSGVDIQIIALWLGHEQIDTTQIYLSESMALKKMALQKTDMNVSFPMRKVKKSELDFLDEI